MPLNNLGTATGNIKINTSDLKNADIALRSAGRGMIYMGAAAVAGFAAVVNEAAKFEKEMDFVQAITVASGDQMDELKKKAIDLGKESVFGPVELAQAFTDLAKAGASVQDIIDGVGDASVQLAQAADVEIPFAGENLINILNTFKLQAGDAAHVADLLAGAANASSVELDDIVTTMRYAGPVAQALGISIEDVNDAISVLGRVGIKGSIAGTSLRFAMTHLIPDTKKAQEAIEGLGLHIDESTGAVVEFTKENGSLKDLADIFQILQERTKDLTDQQKVAVVNDIFGVRAMPSVLELMNAGAEGFAELHAEIEKTTAADVAAKRLDNLSGSIAKLKATIKAVMTEAGGPFQETVKGWVDGLRDLILAFDSLPDGVQKFIVSGLLAFGVLSILSGGFLLTVGNIVRTIRVMGELANAFGVIGKGIVGLTASIAELTIAILTSPIFWIAVLIIAIAAAIYLLWTRSEKFRNFVKGFWEDLKGWAEAIGGFFEKTWNAVVGFFSNWDKWWGKIKEGASAAWDAVKGFLGDIGGAIAEFAGNVWSKITDGVSEAWDTMAGFFSDVGGWFGDLYNTVKGAVGKSVSFIVDQFKSLSWNNIGHAIGEAIGTNLRYVFYEIPKFVGETLATVVKQLWQWYNDILDVLHDVEWGMIHWAEDTFMSFFNTIWGWVSQIPGMIIGFLTQILGWLWEAVPQFLSAAFNIGMSIVTGIIDWVQGLPQRAIELLYSIVTWMINNLPGFAGAAWDIGSSIFNGILDFVMDIPGRINDFINDGINIVRNAVSRAKDAAFDFGKGLWDGFWDGISGSPKSKIEYALMAIDDQAAETGSNLRRTMNSLNNASANVSMSSSAIGIPTASTVANGGAYNQNAPLVGTAVIRRDSDITTLARELEKERRMRARGRGVKLTTDFAAAGV